MDFIQITGQLKGSIKHKLHPHNKHRSLYPFDHLIVSNAELSKFLTTSKNGDTTIDFSDPNAVIELNRALLYYYYKIDKWSIPDGYLCPPIPSRADYIHHVASLLEVSDRDIPKHPGIVCLDIGVGANCVYPIIARAEYNWTCIGSDIDQLAVEHAKLIVNSNKLLKGNVDIRTQTNENAIFEHIVSQDEFIDLTICNPPFHASKEDAVASTMRKNKNLSITGRGQKSLNFGGRAHELWCDGGELSFISRMIEESMIYRDNVYWFTTLVSQEKHLKLLQQKLKKSGVTEVVILPMSQGQKKSRILAWTYLKSEQRVSWQNMRWLK